MKHHKTKKPELYRIECAMFDSKAVSFDLNLDVSRYEVNLTFYSKDGDTTINVFSSKDYESARVAYCKEIVTYLSCGELVQEYQR